jgi:hypothetical protein
VSSKLLKLFFLEVFLGGAGAVAGSMLGKSLGRGGLFIGAVIGGAAMVTVAGYLACRLDCVHSRERFWVIGGGLAGFAAACLVTLATLSSPIGPLAATLLIGIGAVSGATIGRSPHGQP